MTQRSIVHDGIKAAVLFIFVLNQVSISKNLPVLSFSDHLGGQSILQCNLNTAVFISPQFQRFFYKINIGDAIFVIKVLLDHKSSRGANGIITYIFKQVDLFCIAFAGQIDFQGKIFRSAAIPNAFPLRHLQCSLGVPHFQDHISPFTK